MTGDSNHKAGGQCSELSDKERMLLMAYHDRECGAFGCWRARNLLSRSTEAAEFFSVLTDVSSGIKTVVDSTTPELKESLWGAISARIDQEERAAVYLGARMRAPESRRRASFAAPFGWSMAGGLVAASFTVVVIGKMQAVQSITGHSVSPAYARISNSASLDPVGYRSLNVGSGSSSDDLPKILESRDGRGGEPLAFANQSVEKPLQSRVVQNSVDVDWVRSAGAVRFFSDPNQHSTMIWVKKRAPRVQYFSSPVNVVTPVNAVPKNMEFSQGRFSNGDPFYHNERLDDSKLVEQPFSQSFTIEDR